MTEAVLTTIDLGTPNIRSSNKRAPSEEHGAVRHQGDGPDPADGLIIY